MPRLLCAAFLVAWFGVQANAAPVDTVTFTVGKNSNEMRGFKNVHKSGEYEVRVLPASGFVIKSLTPGMPWEAAATAKVTQPPAGDPAKPVIIMLSIANPKAGLAIRFTGILVPIGAGAGPPPEFPFAGNVQQIRLRVDVNGDGKRDQADDSDPTSPDAKMATLLPASTTPLLVQVELRQQSSPSPTVALSSGTSNLLINGQMNTTIPTKQGDSEVTLSARPAIDIDQPLKGDVTGKLKFQDASETADTVKVRAADLKLETLDFLGKDGEGQIVTILKDEDAKNYVSPDWTPSRTEQNPVCYVRASRIRLKPTFRTSHKGKLFIKAETDYQLAGGDLLTFPAREITNNGATNPISFDDWFGDELLKNVVDSRVLTITFKYSKQQNGNFVEFAQTRNQFYAVRDKPRDGVELFRTVVHVGCFPAVGKDAEADVIDAIYKHFQVRKVQTWRGLPENFIGYWRKEADARNANTLQKLLNPPYDGPCGTWAKFFYSTLGAHGIKSTVIGVRPGKLDRQGRPFLVGRSLIMMNGFTRNAQGIPDNENPSIPAQGGIPEIINFQDHALVSIADTLYDPSYGLATTPPKAGGGRDVIAYQKKSLYALRAQIVGTQKILFVDRDTEPVLFNSRELITMEPE